MQHDLETSTGPSGVPGFDRIAGGNLTPGNTYLLQGPSGSGKTTFGLQYLIEGARRGEPALYVGAAETNADIQAIAQSHQWSLDGVTQYYHSPGEEILNAQTILHPAEVELPETVAAIFAEVDRIRPVRLVIDSLAEIRILSREEAWYRRYIILLKQGLRERACTTILTEIPSSNDSIVRSIVTGAMELDSVSPLYGPERRRFRIAKLRARAYTTGWHDYKIRTGGMEIFPRLVAADSRRDAGIQSISSGVPNLDALLCGGLDSATSTLLLGPSGTGKSILAAQFAIAAAQRGERSSLYLFDERIQTLFHRMRGLSMPLEKYVAEGLIEVHQVDPAELTPGEFSELVRRGAQERDVRLVSIDSLNGYMYAMPDERFLVLHLHELAAFLHQQGVTCLFVMATRGLLENEARTPFELSYLADAVIAIRHFEFHGEIRRAISVLKRRSGKHEATIRQLRFGPRGLEVGEPLFEFQGVLTGQPEYLGDNLHAPGAADEP